MYRKELIYREVALLHIDRIRTGFLPSLGLKFLTLMYKCIDESDFATLETDFCNDELRGFVSGTIGNKNLYTEMLKYPIELLFSLIPVLFNLKKAIKIFNLLNHLSGQERAKYPKPELLTICVNKKFQRQGIARNLYKKLEIYFKKNGISNFTIIVGMSLNANNFYQKQGANILGSIQVHSGINSNVFIQEI